MDVDHDSIPLASKKKVDKTESPAESATVKHDSKKIDKKGDVEDPKPRIVLTFRSEKPGAKSSNMKIVPTEEKHEEVSPRRSSRTRAAKWDSDDDNEVLVTPKKVSQPSETDETSDSSHNTPKRSTRRRSKEFENVIQNAIARKEKSYNEPPAPTRPSRRIKPTAKVLANEELRIGLESQNNVRLGISSENVEKSSDDGVRTRRSARSNRQNAAERDVVKETKVEKEEESENDQTQVMKLKHLCELGLKAIVPDESQDEASNRGDPESIEIEDDDTAEDEEVDDDTEVISKLLEADGESGSDSDEDFSCSEEASQSDRRTRRSTRRTTYANDSDQSSLVQEDYEQCAPRRRSTRKKRRVPLLGYEEIVGSYLPQHKKSRPAAQENTHTEEEQEESSNPAAGEEGEEAARPPEDYVVVAACYCEAPSNVYAAPSELTEPVFCQAIEMVDGVRVGCSHSARREADGSRSPLVRAGPRAPYFLACQLHAAQLARHMCCPTCGLFCTQGIFYQCSKGHLFHLECALPCSESKGRSGCPHCGVYSYRWQPANTDCHKVKLDMHCSNKRIFLPHQREQCTPAYLSFSTVDPSRFEYQPVIPEDLLPSPPIDVKALCRKSEEEQEEEEEMDSSPEILCEAILARETVEQLIPKIVSTKRVNSTVRLAGGGTCAHAAASAGHAAALYLLQYAGAHLDALDAAARTPLMRAVQVLLDKSDNKKSKTSKEPKDSEDKEVDESKEEQEGEKQEEDTKEEEINEGDDKSEDKKDDVPRPSDEDLMRVIRYLVAAGCDVNMVGPEGMTALHMAAAHGGEEACAAILSAAGARTDIRDYGGWTPLVWAAENCHAPVVRLLLSHGADAAATDNEGNAVIHWCALGGSARSLQLLLDAAPHTVSALNAHTDTPLHVAARQGHYSCVVILLARGARTDVENSAGELPVEVCTGKCQSAISLNMQMSIAVGDKASRRRLLTSDISRGREMYPVPCINEVDDEPLPEDFTYVTEHVIPRPLVIDYTTESLQGCNCKDGDCSSPECECCVLGVRRWWSRGRLLPAFPYHDPPMLFECNRTCACNAKKCGNSVVTRLLRRGSLWVRAQVFRRGGARGWGLRAAARVPRGSPVAAYCGELLALPEADARAHDHYMFALDVKPDLLDQCGEKTALCVDAAHWGGGARFINHSCRPNLAPVRVFTATRDLRAPTVALFATANIAPGDELTFDYGDKFWGVKSKWMRCECGAADCRYPVKSADDED